MKTKSSSRSGGSKPAVTPDENDFAGLDAWARNLALEDGRPLTATQRQEETSARRVGRPPKPESTRARRVMISMSPRLIRAAGSYAKRTGLTLSGLIAESLAEKIKLKA